MAGSGYRDYFKVLGVDRNANSDSIKRSFRKLARKYHPDVNPGDATSEERFKEITEAYEVLSDPEKRRRYEQFGQYWNQMNNDGGSAPGFDVDFGRYGNFDEFINELLGRFGGMPSQSMGFSGGFPGGFSTNTSFSGNTSRAALNLDAEVKVKLSFSEAFHGSERTLSVNNERVKVQIPKGVKTGSRLRLKSKGNLQPGTGRRGDLYLNLDVQPHLIWTLDDDQLTADLPVSFEELALGATVTAMTPDGEAQICIPPGTPPGRSLRLKGKGWPLKNGRGDLILTLIIHFPDNWSLEELNLLKDLQRVRCNDPREAWIQSARL